MEDNILVGLQETRDELLREYMLSGRLGRAELLTKIMELDEQIEEEEIRNKLM